MRSPICRACGSALSNERAEKCSVCGGEVRAPARVVLKSGRIRLRFHKTVDIGSSDLRMVMERKYVSTRQFRLVKRKNGWRLAGVRGALNSTYLNGKAVLDEEVVLQEGDEIFVGNIASRVGVSLIVELED